jgi:hypothetical protein
MDATAPHGSECAATPLIGDGAPDGVGTEDPPALEDGHGDRADDDRGAEPSEDTPVV